MFTIDQTLSYPSFFQKRLDNFSYFFKRVLPLLLVYFVSFSNSTSAQTTSIYSDACGCGTDKECKFKGPNKVCPGSYNTYCIVKKVHKNYTYLWSVVGDGCYVPAPSECKTSCVTIRAKNICGASYTVKLKILNKKGKVVSTCKKVVWVGDKEKPVITCPPPVTVECYNDIPGHTSDDFYAQGGTASDNCGKVSVKWISDIKVIDEKCKKVIKRTYRAKDKCGLTADCYQLITVEDTQAPVFYNCPGKPIVIKTCDEYAICEVIDDIYATDNCGGEVKYWYKIKELDSDCNSCDYAENDENGWQEGKLSKDRKFKCFKVYLVVIREKDKCGNVSKCKFKIIVKKGDNCQPPVTYKGCTPGFWKNNTTRWCGTYSTGDNFNTVFGAGPNIALLEALNAGGNQNCERLLRHATAALLNECTLGGDYPYDNVAEVKRLTRAALTNGTKEACNNLADDFEAANEAGCPLSGDGNAGIVASKPTTGKPGLSNQESSTLLVRTAPNPYRDRIRFVIQSKVSGPANLELYNLLGQKVQSVYKGQINAGRSQIIDVDVPPSMRTNLIYRLNVGGQFKAGKVIKE